jgi:type III secretion protein Q
MAVVAQLAGARPLPLVRRLRRFGRAQAELARAMYAQAACAAAAAPLVLRWRDAGAPAPVPGLRAITPRGRFWLGVDDWSLLDPALATSWSHVPEAARLALYEQAAEALLALVVQWTGGPIDVEALEPPAAARAELGDGCVELGLRLAVPGRATPAWWIGPPSLLRPAAPAPFDADALARCAALPARLALELGRCTLAAGELAQLVAGDVLRCDAPQRTGALRLVLAAAPTGRAWLAGAQRTTLTVENVVTTRFEPAPAASTTPDAERAAPAAAFLAADPAADLGRVPCTLVFELGRLSVTMAELARVQPGHTFELPVPVAAASVRIVANGRTVGRGELVSLGDEVAVVVQALEIAADG